jgi:hypothetical protein
LGNCHRHRLSLTFARSAGIFSEWHQVT